MKVLDRFILKQLLIPIIYCSATLIFMILIADLFDNLDGFMRYHTAFSVYMKYYLMLIPFSFVQTIHWATWLATIFLFVNLGIHNELLAMKSAGLKIESIVRPILFLGFLIGIFTFIIHDRVVPGTYRTATELREIYIEKNKEQWEDKSIQNVTYPSANKHLYYFRSLRPATGSVSDAIVLWLDEDTGKTYQKISAKKAHWKNGAWEFEGVIEHQIDSRGKVLGEPRTYARKTYLDLTASPVDLTNASRESIFLSYKEIKHAMKKLEETGATVRIEKVELQNRLATPWQSLIMMLMTIPFLAKTRTRKGVAASVLFCVVLAFIYHVSGAIGVALGTSGKLTPFISAWFSNVFFAVASLFNLEKANY
ncbi:MAG: LptF/LptG family permease [Candidatus Omnitrophica bacterium]|nr:LptF/LptG family permease [Candidatus Omnitrophota bacterium]